MKPKATPDDTKCYVQWLKLKRSPDYRKASSNIVALQRLTKESEQRLAEAYVTYQRYFPAVFNSDETAGHASSDCEKVREAYVKAEETCRSCSKRLDTAKEEAAQRFGIFMWWDPEDGSITYENADCIIGPSPVAHVVELSYQDRLNRSPYIDKSGWMTLRVNAAAPLEALESLISSLLRLHRITRKGRHRPDKDCLALEIFELYQECLNFRLLAKRLKRSASTIKRQYVRGCILMNGTPPKGSVKQRRIAYIDNSAAEFEAHITNCQQCNSAGDADNLCEWTKAITEQDVKSLREAIPSRPIEAH